MDKNNKKEQFPLKSLILQISIILILVVGYFFIDFNGLYQKFKGKAQFITQDSSCDLHKESCKVTIQDETTFELSIFPQTIPLMKPLTFTIKSNNRDLKHLSINIYATNMFMGEFNLKLENLGDGKYEAQGTLPTCPVGDMKWNADIRIEKIDETIGARFQFKTDI